MKRHKKAIIFIAIMTFSCIAYSMPAITTEGSVACLKEEWIKDMVSFVAAKDTVNFTIYIEQNKCIVMREGLTVTVTDSPGLLGRYTEFVYDGIKFFTYRDALEYNK